MKRIIATVAVAVAVVAHGETNALPRITHGQSRAAIAARAQAESVRRETRAKKEQEKRTKSNKDTTTPLPHQEHRKAMRRKAK
jgi:hypothetical protein